MALTDASGLAGLNRMTGAELRRLRLSRGLSQTVFGELVGLAQERVSDYERGWCRKHQTILAVTPMLALAARLIERTLPPARDD